MQIIGKRMNAVIFDMDGVLIDSEPLHYASDKELLRELHITAPDDYLDKFVGTTNPFMWSQILKEFELQNNIQEILCKQLELKFKLLEESDYVPIHGIPELLQSLANHNIPMAVASSSSKVFIEAVLKKLNIIHYFTAYISGEEIERSKPEPDIFLKTADILQVNPKECIVIEDSKNRVIAAKRAGMKCAGYINPNSGNQDLSEANIIIKSFTELTVEKLLSL